MKHSDRRGGGSPAKRACRTVVWNEQNLAQCEAGKDAKMKIDEPETPWASPPKELFSDEEPGEARAGGAARAGADMQRVAAQLAAASAGAARGEWDTSDDEMAAAGEVATREGEGAAGAAHGEGHGAHEAELRRRLFEARRKAFQGRHRAAEKEDPETLYKDDEEDDGDAPEHAGAP